MKLESTRKAKMDLNTQNKQFLIQNKEKEDELEKTTFAVQRQKIAAAME